jgi:type II secretory pathway predicted ATPase ExeA
MIQQRSFGLVTGDVGAGKSTAIRALKDGLEPPINMYFFTCQIPP